MKKQKTKDAFAMINQNLVAIHTIFAQHEDELTSQKKAIHEIACNVSKISLMLKAMIEEPPSVKQSSIDRLQESIDAILLKEMSAEIGYHCPHCGQFGTIFKEFKLQ